MKNKGRNEANGPRIWNTGTGAVRAACSVQQAGNAAGRRIAAAA